MGMALFSAFVYGCYTTLMKYFVPDEERLTTALFLGLLGFVNVCTLWPFFFIFDVAGVEQIELPEAKILALLIITGIVNVSSDYFWARSILLTSPLLATMGLSLTIPLGLVADLIFSDIHHDWIYFFGSGLVVSGFLLVNYESQKSLEADEELPEGILAADIASDPNGDSSGPVCVETETDWSDKTSMDKSSDLSDKTSMDKSSDLASNDGTLLLGK